MKVQFMKPIGEWRFRTRTGSDYLSSEDGFEKPYVRPIPFQ
jgi:hypothetical protein